MWTHPCDPGGEQKLENGLVVDDFETCLPLCLDDFSHINSFWGRMLQSFDSSSFPVFFEYPCSEDLLRAAFLFSAFRIWRKCECTVSFSTSSTLALKASRRGTYLKLSIFKLILCFELGAHSEQLIIQQQLSPLMLL